MSAEVCGCEVCAFNSKVDTHSKALRKRGFAVAGEDYPPIGQAAYWFQDVVKRLPKSGREVAKQIARLCGDDSQVTIPWRSLTDAVGTTDKAGRDRAYTERGVEALTSSGWLRVETVGAKRGARTTFYLMPGPRFEALAEVA